MKMRFLGLLLGSLCFTVQSPTKAAPPPKPLWHTNYEEAKEIARQAGKPLFIVFR
jgi:hypothetical protein